jgi:hypothetical protein
MTEPIVCKKDFVMENGPAAFWAGKAYPWRWTTKEEQDDTRCEVAVDGEIGPDHFYQFSMCWSISSPSG